MFGFGGREEWLTENSFKLQRKNLKEIQRHKFQATKSHNTLIFSDKGTNLINFPDSLKCQCIPDVIFFCYKWVDLIACITTKNESCLIVCFSNVNNLMRNLIVVAFEHCHITDLNFF